MTESEREMDMDLNITKLETTKAMEGRRRWRLEKNKKTKTNVEGCIRGPS